MTVFQHLYEFLSQYWPHLTLGGVGMSGAGYAATKQISAVKEQATGMRDAVIRTDDTTKKMTADLATIREESIKQTTLLGVMSAQIAESNGYLKGFFAREK